MPRPKKMENHIFWAGGMLQNGKNRSHCATEVVSIKGHGNMNGGVVCGGGGRGGEACFAIAKLGGFAER